MAQPRWLYLGYLVGALVWAGYTFTRSIPVAIALSAFDGLVFTWATTVFDTRVQAEAQPGARGRIFALVGAFDRGATMTGLLLGGVLASWGTILGGMRLSAGLSVLLLLLTAVPRLKKAAPAGQ